MVNLHSAPARGRDDIELGSAENPSQLTAHWLKTKFTDEVWSVKDERSETTTEFDFRVLLSDGSLLTDSSNATLLETFKTALFLARQGTHFLEASTTKTMRRLFDSLSLFVRWMRLNGVYEFRQITQVEVDEYTTALVSGVSTVLSLPERLREVLEEVRASPPLQKSGGIDRGALASRMNENPGTLRTCAVCVGLIDKFEDDVCGGVRRHKRSERTTAEKASTSQIGFRLQALLAVQVVQHYFPSLDSVPLDVDTTDHREVAKALGGESTQTPLVPADVALTLMNEAARWVIDYSDGLLAMRDQAEPKWLDICASTDDKKLRGERANTFVSSLERPANFDLGSGLHIRRLFDSREKSANDREVSLARAVYQLLPAACYIIIATFSARRHCELMDLKSNCISIDADTGRKQIEFYIAKTEKHRRKFPVTKLLETAVNVMLEVSAPVRMDAPIDQIYDLWLVRKLKGLKGCSSLNSARALNEFASFVGISDRKWQFADHQFRRFFAVSYFWRGGGADLAALSSHMGHFDYDMTIHYISNILKSKEFSHARDEKLRDVLESVLYGEPAAGAMGNVFKRMRRKIQAKLKVKTPKAVALEISRQVDLLVEGSRLDIYLQPWGLCFGMSERRRSRAACSKEGAPAPLEATIHDCAACPSLLVTQDFLPELKQLLDTTEKMLKEPMAPAFRAQAEGKIRILKKLTPSAEASGGAS